MGLVLCRSPVKASRPSLWTWPAVAAMVLGACLLGRTAIARVPASGVEIVEDRLHRERLEALSELAKLVESTGEQMAKLNAAYGEARNATATAPAEGEQILEVIQSDLLTAAGDANIAGKLRELAARAQSQGSPLLGSLDALLSSRERYCAAVAAAHGPPHSPSDITVTDLWIRVQGAQEQMMGQIRLAQIEVLLNKSKE